MIKIFNNLDNDMIGIYLEHNRVINESEPNYKLNETLFSINEPFYMQTEKEAIIKDSIDSNRKLNKKRCKRLLNKNQIYENFLTDPQKLVIRNVFNDVKHIINVNKLANNNNNGNNNESAQQLAQIALNSIQFDEYSDKLLCNNSNKSVNFSNFIIPPNCSFMCSDVIKGLDEMREHYINGLFKISNEFLVVIDPPYKSNKSAKRKRFYHLDDRQTILQMTEHLKQLLQLLPKQTDIKLCVWTTQKEREFVINDMLPILNVKCTHILVWHKITTSGESVKIRGSLEYLIIASNKSLDCHNSTGILLSIPSAIHSHKPPLKQLVKQLFYQNDVNSCDTMQTYDKKIVVTDCELNSVKNEDILTQAMAKNISGLELYARYLNSGFHSIGFECLKLQNHLIYN